MPVNLLHFLTFLAIIFSPCNNRLVIPQHNPPIIHPSYSIDNILIHLLHPTLTNPVFCIDNWESGQTSVDAAESMKHQSQEFSKNRELTISATSMPPHPSDLHLKNNGDCLTPLPKIITQPRPPPAPNEALRGSAKGRPSAHGTGTLQSQHIPVYAIATPSTSTTHPSALTMPNQSGTERIDKLTRAQKVKDFQAAEVALQQQLDANRKQQQKDKKTRQEAHKREEE